MKLIGKLADNVNKAKNPEEAKGIIRDAGMELSDEEMGQVFGGMGVHRYSDEGIETHMCKNGHWFTAAWAKRCNYICTFCKEKLEYYGDNKF